MSYLLKDALRTANRVKEILEPSCRMINIAGSIARRKKEVKDIEIVCLPKKIYKKSETSLFEEGEWVIDPSFDDGISLFAERIEKGKSSGRMMKIILKDGKPLDLFMPQEHDYFRQLVIRTGSADYVHHIIAAAWRHKGWCGVAGQGLRLISECRAKNNPTGKPEWICIKSEPTLPPVWKSEEEFFTWLDLPFTPPDCREIFFKIKSTLNYYQ